jgi:hypothetical protein
MHYPDSFFYPQITDDDQKQYLEKTNNSNIKNKVYKFISPECKNNYEFEKLKPVKFYQITSFMIPQTQQYEIRICDINEYNEFVKYKKAFITKKYYKYIIKNYPSNIYKLYSCYDLDNIGLPTINDIMSMRSCNTY